MDLNEIMHFLKRAVSFKTRDAGTVTWASERPAPRGEPQGSIGSGCFGGHASFGAPGPDARGSRGARAARSSLCSPAGFPSFRLRVSDAQMLPRRRLACLEAALLAVPPPGPLNPGPRHPAAEPRAAPAHVTGSLTA